MVLLAYTYLSYQLLNLQSYILLFKQIHKFLLFEGRISMLLKEVPVQHISQHISIEMVNDLNLNPDLLNSYLIALEGWRRGLTVRWHSQFNQGSKFNNITAPLKRGQLFSLSTKQSTHYFVDSLGDLNLESINVLLNKDKINDILKSRGLNIVEEKAQNLVKEYRLYVLDKEVIGALEVKSPYIIGDGLHTINELIENKNKWRKDNPNYNRYIPVDDYFQKSLSENGYELDEVLDKDVKLFLNDFSKRRIKKDTYGIINDLSNEIVNMAIDVTQAIPELSHGEIRIVADQNFNYYVSGINIVPRISDYMFPLYGEPSNISKAIIDLYFPETNSYDTYKLNNVYFPLESILESLQNQTANTFTVSPAPKEPVISRKFIIQGDVLSYSYHLGLRKELFERDLFGKITSLKNRRLEIIVSGTDESLIDDFKKSIFSYPKRAKVKKIQELPFDGGVKIGVEIKTGKFKRQRKALRLQRSLDKVSDELYNLEVEHANYINSISWKITYPLRKFTRIFKRERLKRVFPFL